MASQLLPYSDRAQSFDTSSAPHTEERVYASSCFPLQIQRTSWHPSVAIWGGNNEIEGSLNWYAESRSNRAMFANDYQALFVDTIRREIRAVSHTMFGPRWGMARDAGR
jgi:beta-galactosidase/beta-glucuronidase